MRLTKTIKRRLEEKERAIYIRLPHRIRSEQDVAKFFRGEFKVELIRQASRHCYVIFPSVEEKLKNLEIARKLRGNGTRVVIAPAITKMKSKPKAMRKKIFYPKIKEEIRVTKMLFVSNIKSGIKLQDLKAAIPGCIAGKILKAYSKDFRGAMLKMESAQIAAEYLKKIRPQPIVAGVELQFYPDTRKKKQKPDDAPLKIYDGEKEIMDIFSERKDNNALDHIVLENKE